MKKIIIYSGILFCLSFFVACDDKTSETTVVKSTEPAITTVDTAQRTNISIGNNGADINSKNTHIQVNGKGIKVGTKKINIDIK